MSQFTITRQQESELPCTLSIQFINVNTDYQQGSQMARRMAVASKQKTSVNAPIVFDDTEAKNIAEKLLYNVWVERDRFKFTLPRKYAYLEPTDVINLYDSTRNITFTVRIVKMSESRKGDLEFEATADTSVIYQQNAVTTPATVVTQVPAKSSNTIAVLFDIPALRVGDVAGGFYVAMCGETAVWAGGLLYQSIDGGANYTPFLSGAPAATIGVATTALGGTVSDWSVQDDTNTVTVQLYGGKSLQSTTDTGITNGKNLAVLESAEGWEVFQFKTATLVGAGLYELSALRRGNRLTRYAAPGHAIGNRFVLLEQPALLRAIIPNEQLNTGLKYRILTAGQLLGAGTDVTFASTGEALKYGSLVEISSSSGWGSDIEFHMQPVFDTYDYLLTPAVENRTYSVEIWDSTFTTLKRTLTALTPGDYAPTLPYDFKTTYTAAQQTSDFGSTQSTLYMKIFGASPVAGSNHSPKFVVTSSGVSYY